MVLKDKFLVKITDDCAVIYRLDDVGTEEGNAGYMSLQFPKGWTTRRKRSFMKKLGEILT